MQSPDRDMGPSSYPAELTPFLPSLQDTDTQSLPTPIPPPSATAVPKSPPPYPDLAEQPQSLAQSLDSPPLFTPAAGISNDALAFFPEEHGNSDHVFLSDLQSDALSPVSAPVPVSKQPLDFPAVWRAIMSNPLMRLWVFTIKPPDVHELLLARENGPFEKSFECDIPADANFDAYAHDKIWKNRLHEVFGSCYKLSCGSHLGIVVNSMSVDVAAPPFAMIDPVFADASLVVNRMVVLCLDNVLVAVEFCWLGSGALIIRFYPFNSISSAERGDLNMVTSIYAFKPNDARALATCALVGSDVDFLNANFDAIVMEGYYCYEMFDTKFQAACIYCQSRGMPVCDCPMPMRRRWTDDETTCTVVPYEIPVQGSVWRELPIAKLLCSRPGTLVFNCKMRPHSQKSVVLFSGSFAYDFKMKGQLCAHPVLQRHMGFSQFAVNPIGLIMESGIVLETSSDSTEKNLTPPPTGMANSLSWSDKRTFHQADTNTNVNVNVNINFNINTNPNADIGMGTNMAGLHYFIPSSEKRPRSNPRSITSEQLPQTPPDRIERDYIIYPTTDSSSVQHKLKSIASATRNSRNGTDASSPAAGIERKLENTTTNNNSKTPKKRRPASNVDAEMTIIEVDGVQKRSWTCPECGVSILNKKSNLTRHIDTKHKTNTQRFECTHKECSLSFQTKHNRKRHFLHAHQQENGTGRSRENRTANNNNKGNGNWENKDVHGSSKPRPIPASAPLFSNTSPHSSQP